MNGIIRVFPRKTNYTPVDEYAIVGDPPLPIFIPEHKEVHVSCTFTWDKAECERLAAEWDFKTGSKVKLGGPAYGSDTEEFIPGMYIKPNIIFTTRGCNNQCPFCLVPRYEGKLKELPIYQGNIIQDNNFLQASKAHKDKVFEMLRTQYAICFKGGLQTDLIDDHFINNITSLRIKELWLACDRDADLPRFKRAVEKLKKAGFNRNKIYCYALIGDDIDKNEARLREIYNAGAMPFAQLYKDFADTKKVYSAEWNSFSRQWMRPAAINAHMKKGTEWWEYGT